MARLPIPGGDTNNWGTVLNDFLAQAHNSDGSLKTDSVGAAALADNIVTNATIAAGADIDQSKIHNLTSDLSAKAPLASPTFTGTVTVPTPTTATDAATKGYMDSYQRAAYDLRLSGLSDLTTDITTVLTAAVVAGYKNLLVPYRTTAWPMLTGWTGTGIILTFEKGARISFNMATGTALNLTDSTLINASFTSPFTGPTSLIDATANYAYPAREVLMHDNCSTMGSYYQEYAVTGIHIVGAHIDLGPTKFKGNRHRTGWGQAIHIDGSSAYDIRCGRVQAEACDRGIEIEAGAHDVTFYAGGHLKNIYPNGYTGQPTDGSGPDGAAYAGYTFVLDGHTHSGEGGVSNLAYKGEWFLEQCGAGVTFLRSTGSNDADYPRNCHVDTLHVVGRSSTSVVESVLIEGHNNTIDTVHMQLGTGVTANTRQKVIINGGTGNRIGKIFSEAFSVPLVVVQSAASGTTIGSIRATDSKVDGSGFLVDVAGPYTKLERVDAFAIAGTTGYVRFQATASGSELGMFNWSKKAGETFTDGFVDLSVNTKASAVANSPLLASASRAGKFLSLPNRPVTTNNALGNGTLRTTPVYIPTQITIDQLGTEITAGGDAACVIRIGIFTDVSGLPAAVLADVTVLADAIATPMATLGTPLTLQPGWYHIGGVLQGVTVTQPTVRVTTTGTDDFMIFNSTVTTVAPVGYTKSGVTTTLAAWGVFGNTGNIVPRIWARVV